jgi:hypothetical protein
MASRPIAVAHLRSIHRPTWKDIFSACLYAAMVRSYPSFVQYFVEFHQILRLQQVILTELT